MKKAIWVNLAAVAAMALGSIATTTPASARDGYGRGDYSRGGYGGYNEYRGYEGYHGAYGNYRGGGDGYYGGYRGGDYRCHNDGAAGTIIGAIAGGLIGNGVVGRHGDRTAGTIAGGALGGLAGRAIDRGGNRC